MERSCRSIFKLTNMVAKNFFKKRSTSTLITIQKRDFSVNAVQTPSEEETSPREPKAIHLLRSRISEELSKSKNVDWKAIIEEALQMGKSLNQRNISTKILNACSCLQDFDAGKAFLSYLRSSGSPLNLGVLLTYIKLCYSFKDRLTKDDLQELGNICETISSKYHMFLEGIVINDFMIGLALTNRLEEGLKYLELIKESGVASTLAYSALIETAASLKEFDIALKLFEECYNSGKETNSSTVVDFITHCADCGQASHIESLLYKMNKYMIIPEADFAEKLVELSSKELIPFKGSMTSISGDRCQHCSQALTRIKITKEEYDDLRAALISDSLIGSNIFQKTNPDELKTFLTFIKKAAPYDIVIDGMNIVYLLHPGGPKICRSRSLEAVVRQFASQNKRILIFLRKHMKKQKDKAMNYVASLCDIFYIENDSSDDNYLLYAALHSPLGTYFISRDFMRSHKSSLSTIELQRTFKLWQQSHQIVPYPSGQRIILHSPVEHYLLPHASQDGTWHIPYSTAGKIMYVNDHYYINLPTLETSKTFSWLCLPPIDKFLMK